MASSGSESVTSAEIRELVRAELERVRTDARAELRGAARAVTALYAASLLLYLAAVFLTLMTVYILGALIEPWIGAAVVGTTLLVVSLVVLSRARSYVDRIYRGS